MGEMSKQHPVMYWALYSVTFYMYMVKGKYIKVSDKMALANSAATDQTAPKGFGSTMSAIRLSILRNNCITSKP